MKPNQNNAKPFYSHWDHTPPSLNRPYIDSKPVAPKAIHLTTPTFFCKNQECQEPQFTTPTAKAIQQGFCMRCYEHELSQGTIKLPLRVLTYIPKQERVTEYAFTEAGQKQLRKQLKITNQNSKTKAKTTEKVEKMEGFLAEEIIALCEKTFGSDYPEPQQDKMITIQDKLLYWVFEGVIK